MVTKNLFGPLFFLLLGIVSILGQSAILREITTLFYGNELFYGLGLGIWLFSTGLGSLILPKITLFKKQPKWHWLILLGLFFLLPLLIISLRLIVAKFVPLGELPGFRLAFLILGGSLFIFCFPLGMVFPLAVRSWQKGKKIVNAAYFWETIGLALGGLFFSFFLASSSFPLLPKIDYSTIKWRYPNLTKTINSKYFRITVTKSNGQLNFFLGGQLAFNSQEDLENQKFLSLIKPFCENTDKILVSANPILAKNIAEQFGPEKIDLIEIDNVLLGLEREFLPPKINLIAADPRKFLKQTNQKWDLIIYSLGNPQTLLANRYFTKESFAQLWQHLTDKGIFVLSFYLPTDYQSREALFFGSSIYQTFKNVFPKIEFLIQEDQIILIGGQNLQINNIKIEPLWQKYFWFQIESPKRQEIQNRLTSTVVKLNTDLKPSAFFYHQLFWQTIFSFKLPKIIQAITGIILVSLVIFFWTLLLKTKTNLGWLMAQSSFLLISLETIIIIIFQTKIGQLYSQISLIFSLFLVGMASGVTLTKNRKSSLKLLKKIWFFLLMAIIAITFGLSKNIIEYKLFWLITTFCFGAFGGAIFALINNLYLKENNHPGYVYSFDLFGSCLGAILTASFLLPLFGVRTLLAGLAGILLINLLAIARLRLSSPDN